MKHKVDFFEDFNNMQLFDDIDMEVIPSEGAVTPDAEDIFMLDIEDIHGEAETVFEEKTADGKISETGQMEEEETLAGKKRKKEKPKKPEKKKTTKSEKDKKDKTSYKTKGVKKTVRSTQIF